MKHSINYYLGQANNLRFKMLAIVGNNENKKIEIIDYLKKKDWTLIDVESELLKIRDLLNKKDQSDEVLISETLKKWFETKPNKVILTNADILYHDYFQKISPIAAFKYRTRNKQTVIFLDNEKLLGNRIIKDQAVGEYHTDQLTTEIVAIDINDIEGINDNMDLPEGDQYVVTSKDPISQYFNFNPIKDVVDIDSDLATEESRKEIVSSFIISESLEKQLVSFLENLSRTNHKAVKIIGNYGSGKSHLIAFLVAILSEPTLREKINNDLLKSKITSKRDYKIVQFELLAGNTEMSKWFYKKVSEQLKKKYEIEIPDYADSSKDFDDKDNLSNIIKIVKEKDPTACLVVIMDEVSDFIAQKELHAIKRDFGFLRAVAQFCQANDMMLMISMQEDVYTNPKFMEIASNEERISERFQNIVIHKEDIRKVISNRIISKTAEQRHNLENRLTSFSAKNSDLSRKIDHYLDLFPLTPALLNYFEEMPYFEKRGVIQFVQTEVKEVMNREFPFFLTFDYIFDVLENNPNKSNLEEIYKVIKAVEIIRDKLVSFIDNKQDRDIANKIVKGLAVNHIRSNGKTGMSAVEIADYLMIMPTNILIQPQDSILMLVKKIREATDGNYIKIVKDAGSETSYLKFDLDTAIDLEEKIEQKINTISEDVLENEIFTQIKESLDLISYKNNLDIFEYETEWKSVKSFREGYLIFAKKGYDFPKLPERDFALVIISPSRKEPTPKFSLNQIEINFQLGRDQNTEIFKRICAIRTLININFNKSRMKQKLDETINGSKRGATDIPGVKYRLNKLFYNICNYKSGSGEFEIKKYIHKQPTSIVELLSTLTTNYFSSSFDKLFHKHPCYSQQLSLGNIGDTLSGHARELVKGEFNNLTPRLSSFLSALDLINAQHYPDYNGSELALEIYTLIKKENGKVIDIEAKLVNHFAKEPFGIEADMVRFILIFLTTAGYISLKQKGGKQINISNIKQEFKSLSTFDSIPYCQAQENCSYDFAERLLNTLGLVGREISLEKNRIDAFRKYKDRILQLRREREKILSLEKTIKHYSHTYLELSQVEETLTSISMVNWDELDISNHSQFSKIEEYNSELELIKKNCQLQENTQSALLEYTESIHSALDYMKDALAICIENRGIASKTDLTILTNHHEDVLNIVSDFSRFITLSERNPISGKIEAFKSKYINECYIPYHEKMVGKKINWQELTSLHSNRVSQQISQLLKINFVSSAIYQTKIAEWERLKEIRCLELTYENLNINPKCNRCNMPKAGVDYTKTKTLLNNINDTLIEIYEKYAKDTVATIIDFKDNLKLIDIPDKERNIIEMTIADHKMPDNLNDDLITAISQLTTEIDVVEIKRSDMIDKLFPRDGMMSLETIRKAFHNFENEIVRNKKESEIRIKVID